MGKNYLKRLTVPNTWTGILKKTNKYIVRPRPGPHAMIMSMPIALLLRQLGHAKNQREIRQILNDSYVLVNKSVIKDPNFPVGFMDALAIPKTGEQYRMIISNHGKLELVKETANVDKKLSRVIGKTVLKEGRIQLNLSDGRNLLTDDKKYRLGDSLVISVPDQKIINHLSLAPSARIVLIGGKHIGERGELANIHGKELTYKDAQGNMIKTLKQYAYVIGDFTQ